MAERKSYHPQFPHKNPFHILSPKSCHVPAPVKKLTLPESPSESLKKRKLKASKHRGGKENNCSSGHYVPTSRTLSPNNSLPNSSSVLPPARHRWSSKLACFEKEGMSPLTKTNDSNTLRCQARKVLRRIFSSHKSFSPSRAHLATSQSSSSHAKSKSASEDALDTPKPTISYPMKLHNSDLSFVTTQDPWEASVRSSSLRRRATLGTRHSEERPSSRAERRFSSCQPSISSNRLSFGHRASNELSRPRALQPRRTTGTTFNGSTTSDRPNSAIQYKSSLDSKRSDNYSFPSNRGSLYRHPPIRPLSISHHSRRNSALVLGDEISKRITVDAGSRRSSMVSSNLTSTTNQIRQSWTIGRAVLETSTLQGSALTCSERSFVSTSGTDQKSVSSYRLPTVNNWAGVMEEDITVTLMGSPDSATDSKKRFSPDVTPKAPKSAKPSKPPPPITSSASSTSPPGSPSPIPPQSSSCPTLPSLDISTPSTPPPVPPALPEEPPYRPLSLFKEISSPLIEVIGTQENQGSDWYAELMTTVEQTISQIN